MLTLRRMLRSLATLPPRLHHKMLVSASKNMHRVRTSEGPGNPMLQLAHAELLLSCVKHAHRCSPTLAANVVL